MEKMGMSFRGLRGPLSLKLFELLDDDQIKTLIKILNESKFPLENRGREQLHSLIEKVIALSERAPVDNFFGAFLLQILHYSDDYEEFKRLFVQPIQEYDAKEEIKKRAIDLINSLNYIEEFFKRKRLESYKQRANIFFSSISFTCDLRARFKTDYKYDSISIDEYSPEIVDLVPLATIEFVLGGEFQPLRFSFQADDKELDEIISNLLAAQKDLRKLNKFMKETKK